MEFPTAAAATATGTGSDHGRSRVLIPIGAYINNKCGDMDNDMIDRMSAEIKCVVYKYVMEQNAAIYSALQKTVAQNSVAATNKRKRTDTVV